MKKMTSICVLLLMLPVVARCLSIAHEEGTAQIEKQDDNVNIQHEYQRGKRSGNTNLDPRQNCNTWSPWINRHHPNNASDPSDRERVTKQEMDAFCPPQHGGRASNISCKDEKGEAFFGNQTGATGVHFVSCYSPFVGAECVLLIKSSESCPDVSMQYFCSCSNETSVTSSPDMSTTKKHQLSTLKHGMSAKHMSTTTKHQLSTLKHGMSTKHLSTTTKNQLSTLKHGMSLKQAEKQNSSPTDGFNAGRLFVPWWILYLLIALVLFSVCMCTIVCMYRHLKKKLRDGKHGPKVHPTA